jgi:hypothetical protein
MSDELMPSLQFARNPVAYKDEAGHTLYKDEYFVEIRQRGSKDSVTKPAEEWIADLAHKGMDRSGFDQYAPMYAAWHEKAKMMFDMFKRGEEIPEDGMSLKAFPAFSPAEILICKGVDLYTLEQLSEASEQALQRMGPGARNLKAKAGKMLENYHNGKAAEENAALRQQLGEIKAKYHELEMNVSRLLAEKSDIAPEAPVIDLDTKIAEAIARAMAQVEIKRGPGRPPKSEAA